MEFCYEKHKRGESGSLMPDKRKNSSSIKSARFKKFLNRITFLANSAAVPPSIWGRKKLEEKRRGEKKKKKKIKEIRPRPQHPSPRSFQPHFIFKRYFSDKTDSGREDFCCEKIRVSRDGATIPFPSFLPSFIRLCATDFSDESNRPEPSPSLHFRPKFEYSFPRRMSPSVDVQILRPIWILFRPAVADHHLIVYSWSRLSFRFFFPLFICWKKWMHNICKKKKNLELKI